MKNVKSTLTITDNTGKKVLKVMEIRLPIIPLHEGEVSLKPLGGRELMTGTFNMEDISKRKKK